MEGDIGIQDPQKFLISSTWNGEGSSVSLWQRLVQQLRTLQMSCTDMNAVCKPAPLLWVGTLQEETDLSPYSWTSPSGQWNCTRAWWGEPAGANELEFLLLKARVQEFPCYLEASSHVRYQLTPNLFSVPDALFFKDPQILYPPNNWKEEVRVEMEGCGGGSRNHFCNEQRCSASAHIFAQEMLFWLVWWPLLTTLRLSWHQSCLRGSGDWTRAQPWARQMPYPLYYLPSPASRDAF